MEHATSTQPAGERLHALDAVRGGALILGVFFHAALSFLPGDQFWLVMDTQRSGEVAGLAFVLHMFRMTVFFLLAGYFARLQTHRLGLGRFAVDRTKRIVLPLVVFWPLILTAIVSLSLWMVAAANGGVVPDDLPPPPPLTAETFPLTHLWFLYVLVLFYGAAIFLRGALMALRLRGAVGQLADICLLPLAKLGLLPLLMVVPATVLLTMTPGLHPFFGVPTPDVGLMPNPVALSAYGAAFVAGWWLQRDRAFLAVAMRLWPLYLLVAAALTAYCLSVVGVTVTWVQPLPPAASRWFPAAYGVATGLWAFGFMGLALAVWSGAGAVRRYLADASYWIYLVHLPVVMALQIALAPLAWPALAKYAIVVLATMLVTTATYALMVRRTWIGAWLNGRRKGAITPARQETLG